MKLSPPQIAYLQAVTTAAPILVSDDETMTRALYRAIFERVGIVCIDVWSATEVLPICHEQPISLIISDVRNPHLSGLEMLSQLRDDPDVGHIPILIVTATSNTQDEAYERGANGYINKPFAPDDILMAVWHLIGMA